MFDDIMDQINETRSEADRLIESVRLYNAKSGFIEKEMIYNELLHRA